LYEGHAVIADFGLSKLVDTTTVGTHKAIRGTIIRYQSIPELAEEPLAPRTKQVDIYMLGLCAQEVGTVTPISWIVLTPALRSSRQGSMTSVKRGLFSGQSLNI
jgi:hypothetical protein